MIKIQPVNAKVLILPLPRREAKLGSLILPNQTNSELEEGEVVARAKNLTIDEMEMVSVGDRVIYPIGVGVRQLIDGKEHVWVTIGDLLGITTEEVTPEDKGDSL